MEDKNISVSELSVEFGKKKFTGEWISSQLRFLLGRVLTVVDSSVTDPRQNKAMKDIIKGEFIGKLAAVSDVVSDGKDIVAPEDFDPTDTVEEDVALGLK